MKKLIGSALLLLAATTQAQMPNVGGIDMSKLPDMGELMGMVGSLGDMANCMAQLDQQRLEQLGQQAEAYRRELEQLCVAGKRDEAQRNATGYAREFMASPEYQHIMQCGAAVQDLFPELASLKELEADNLHVCDEL